mgnify:FL=1
MFQTEERRISDVFLCRGNRYFLVGDGATVFLKEKRFLFCCTLQKNQVMFDMTPEQEIDQLTQTISKAAERLEFLQAHIQANVSVCLSGGSNEVRKVRSKSFRDVDVAEAIEDHAKDLLEEAYLRHRDIIVNSTGTPKVWSVSARFSVAPF